MKCIEVKESLDAFLDGEIDLSSKEKIGSHLEICVSCQTEFTSIQTIGEIMKEALPIAAPSVLDEKVFSAFQRQHSENEVVEIGGRQGKTGWFGIPKFAFATVFLLLALFSGFAFQLGRMSAESVQASKPEDGQEFIKKQPITEDTSKRVAQAARIETKIVEVPVIRKEIVRVPVFKEKVVIRTVYVTKQKDRQRKAINKSDFAINNSVKDGEVLSKTNLKGFEPVAETKLSVTKKEE